MSDRDLRSGLRWIEADPGALRDDPELLARLTALVVQSLPRDKLEPLALLLWSELVGVPLTQVARTTETGSAPSGLVEGLGGAPQVRVSLVLSSVISDTTRQDFLGSHGVLEVHRGPYDPEVADQLLERLEEPGRLRPPASDEAQAAWSVGWATGSLPVGVSFSTPDLPGWSTSDPVEVQLEDRVLIGSDFRQLAPAEAVDQDVLNHLAETYATSEAEVPWPRRCHCGGVIPAGTRTTSSPARCSSCAPEE